MTTFYCIYAPVVIYGFCIYMVETLCNAGLVYISSRLHSCSLKLAMVEVFVLQNLAKNYQS